MGKIFTLCSFVFITAICSAQPAERVLLRSNNTVVTEQTVSSFLRESLHTTNADSFVIIRRETDQQGQTHLHLRHYLSGTVVKGTDLLAHFSGGQLYLVNGRFHSGIIDPGSPKLTHAEAEQKLHLLFPQASAENIITEILPATQQHPAKKVFRFTCRFPDEADNAGISIDASSGELVSKENISCHIDVPGTAATRYSGTQNIICDSVSPSLYYLRQSGPGQGINTRSMNNLLNLSNTTDIISASPSFGNTADAAAYEAHWCSEKELDYLSQTFNRYSLNGMGLALESYVHYGTGYDGAIWNGSAVLYGDGSQVPGGSNEMTCVDIAGHEYTHGLTQFTAGLGVMNENGALNEAFSDIFGTMLEFFAKPSSADFFIGEECAFTAGTMLRSMQDPNSMQMPDTYLGNYWYTGTADNGGIHTNCNVVSYWFYLLCNGGSGVNDNGESYSIPALSLPAAERIAYRTLVYYLPSNADFVDARQASILATEALYGKCTPEVIAVTNAWHAVGVGNQFSGYPQPAFTYEMVQGLPMFQTISFSSNSINADSAYWNFGDGSGTEPGPDAVHEYITGGAWTVTLVVTSNEGCTDSITQQIIVDGLALPNVFTPNGDGVNDVFLVSNSSYGNFELGIFNRSGRKISSISGSKLAWEGNDWSGKECPEGTYYYVLKGKTDFREYERTGFITLLRAERGD